MILNDENVKEARKFFREIIDLGISFKLEKNIIKKHLSIKQSQKILTSFPKKGKSLDKILKEFKTKILPYCTNFSSPNFMGFPDSGNSVAALSGALLKDFLQQNLINQSFCGPSATFVEIAVIQWLREIVGYKNKKINDIWDVGGVITGGGTASNAIGILLARENKYPNTMEQGVANPNKCWLVVPKNIGHYSVKSSQMWAGCGNHLIEVETKNYRYDLEYLEKKLIQHKGKIIGLVAYAGDSRTMTVDRFDKIANLVKKIDPSIWLHADACHGFSLGFSQKLKYKIKGIEKFDSITLDPHKVLATPYVISVLLVKDPQKMKKVTSLSDLIMQEKFAFGQITPYLGSRSWESLKLWFVLKNYGKDGWGHLIEKRHQLAQYLTIKLEKDPDFIVINKVEINSVAFMFCKNIDLKDYNKLNTLNKNIHQQILKEGKIHLHQFSIPDDGRIKKGEIIYPQRFMCGNPNTTKRNIDEMIEYVRQIGLKCLKKLNLLSKN